MTDNNVNKYIAKRPFIPKTETRIFLGGRPIDQQTEQTGSKGISKQPYQSERIGEINPGYGPVVNGPNCKPAAVFEVKIILNGDYVLTNDDGTVFLLPTVASGKIEDQNFSAIQKTIDDFKSGKIKVYKGRDPNNDSRERTEECVKFEGYFEASLENALKELKKKPHYGEDF